MSQALYHQDHGDVLLNLKVTEVKDKKGRVISTHGTLSNDDDEPVVDYVAEGPGIGQYTPVPGTETKSETKPEPDKKPAK